MTLNEFREEFDILYNSVTSNAAPPLDDYERSVFLTQAQEKLVRDYYNPAKDSFEQTEEKRRDLSNLISSAFSSPITYPSDFINQNSKFFEINDDVMFIVHERVKLSSSDPCLKNRVVNVKPVTHDEYNIQINNPFKKPSKNVAWRIDYKEKNDKRVVEILTVENTKAYSYTYRYIKYPNPIILSDLVDMTINDQSQAINSDLPNAMHRDILNAAVEIALETIGSPRFKSKYEYNKTEY